MSEEIYLYPEEFSVDPAYNSRRWPLTISDLDRESASLRDLAASIDSQGQLTTCVSTLDPGRPLPHVLVIGLRRRRAIADLNQKRLLASLPLLKLRTRVDRTSTDMLQKAIVSNLFERSFSPMEIAAILYHLQKTYHWPNATLAKYLGLSTPNVTQHLRLLTQGNTELHNALHSGLITPQSAFDILKTDDAKRSKIMELASYIESSSSSIQESSSYKRQTRGEQETVYHKITHGSVIRAIEELGAGVKPRARNRTEIGKLVIDLDSPKYGYRNSPIRLWARSLLEWIQGIEPQVKLDAKFTEMVRNTYRGTKMPSDDADQRRYHRRLKRLPRSDIGQPKVEPLFDASKPSKIYKGVIEL